MEVLADGCTQGLGLVDGAEPESFRVAAPAGDGRDVMVTAKKTNKAAVAIRRIGQL